MPVTFDVNGRRRTIRAAPDTPLLHVLRNDLELCAAKFGCGLAQCGACMVLVDGEAMPSCVLPISQAAGRRIVTLEGLGSASQPGRLQRAFVEEQAAQCGYCIAGMIISAEALLAANPHPTEEEIRVALARNLCRCGTDNRIVRAVRRAAAEGA